MSRFCSFYHTMYSPTKPVERCQCCQQRVSLTDTHCSSYLFGYNYTSEVIYSSNPVAVHDSVCANKVRLTSSTAATHSPPCILHRRRSARSPVAFIYKNLLDLQLLIIVSVKHMVLYCGTLLFESIMLQ